jgi:hypothetical protein
VQRYVDALRSIAEHKESRGGNGQVLVAVLAGVPEDYPESGDLTYRDSTSAAFNREYGIGPGCNIGQEEIDSPPGIPPVRLREFAEAFATEERNIFSICSEDYAIALEQIAEAAGRLSARACVPGCVTDTNRYIDGLQPRCTLVEEKTSEREMPVQSCVARNGTWEFPGPEVDVCYRALSDVAGLTSTAVDDMSPQCITRGANLEFVVERRPGIPIQAGTAVRVDCELDGPSTQTCLPS